MRLKLRSKILAPLILAITATFFLQIGVFKDSLQRSLRQEFTSKGKAIVQTLAGSVQDTLLNRDASTIQGFIDQYRDIQGVEYIYIQDEKGEIIAHTFHPIIPEKFSQARKSPQAFAADEVVVRDIRLNHYKVIHIQAPILAGLLGSVYVGMALEKEENRVLWPMLRKSLAIEGAITIFALGIAIMVLMHVLNPILLLISTAKEIVKTRNLSLRVGSDEPDEVGELSRAFDSMVIELQQYTEHLQEIIDKKSRELEVTKQNLVEVSKMSALGEMAGGIAHEVNNPNAIIYGYAENLEYHLEQPEIDRKALLELSQKIQVSSERIGVITKGLRQFCREGSRDPFEIVSVKRIIDDTVMLCDKKFENHGIKLNIGNVPESLSIECQMVPISQVLVNLLQNAYDAIETLPDRWISIEVCEVGESVNIVVSDSGSGIPDEIAEKMMDPFFTTKPVGKGTGMGLSISAGIVQLHGGRFYLDSECKNTKFVVALPKVQSDQSKQAA